jgi:hypothetical protein
MERDGGSAGARTQDQYLKRVLLYQLSYRPGRLRGAGMVLLEVGGVQLARVYACWYAVGSCTPAASKPARRRRQESHRPQARPSPSAW